MKTPPSIKSLTRMPADERAQLIADYTRQRAEARAVVSPEWYINAMDEPTDEADFDILGIILRIYE